jgi:hypothetical protein
MAHDCEEDAERFTISEETMVVIAKGSAPADGRAAGGGVGKVK